MRRAIKDKVTNLVDFVESHCGTDDAQKAAESLQHVMRYILLLEGVITQFVTPEQFQANSKRIQDHLAFLGAIDAPESGGEAAR